MTPGATPAVSPAGAPRGQVCAHRGVRVDLPGPEGPVAALRAVARPRTGDEPWDAVALLVPGYGGSKEDFAPLLDPVADAGIDALAVDLPGQYETPAHVRDTPAATEAAHRPTALGTVVAALARAEAAAGRTVLLLGHSYGGLVARAALLAGAPAIGLTLLASGPAALPMGPSRTRLDVLEPALRRRGTAGAVAVHEDAGDWADLDDDLVAFLRRRLTASSPPALLGMGAALRSEPDRTPELLATVRGGRVAPLVVCGTTDDAWPVAVQRTMAERLDAEFAAVAGAGHTPNTENPAGLLDVLVPTWRTWLREATLEP